MSGELMTVSQLSARKTGAPTAGDPGSGDGAALRGLRCPGPESASHAGPAVRQERAKDWCANVLLDFRENKRTLF